MLSRAAIISLLLLFLLPSAAWSGITGLTKNGDLKFGNLLTPGSSGTVTVTQAGARSSTAGITLRSGSTVTAASFTVTGSNNSSYTITLPANNTVVISSGGNTFTLTNFTCSAPLDDKLGAGNSSLTFTVGATAVINSNPAPGSYSGSFNITVN
ncbi:MAG: DUF4402 domain-containing protein [Verrucomicrobia bacterium]|nr:DUF4402 domain-containing protein [Deltaproteobacteria bacterium]